MVIFCDCGASAVVVMMVTKFWWNQVTCNIHNMIKCPIQKAISNKMQMSVYYAHWTWTLTHTYTLKYRQILIKIVHFSLFTFHLVNVMRADHEKFFQMQHFMWNAHKHTQIKIRPKKSINSKSSKAHVHLCGMCGCVHACVCVYLPTKFLTSSAYELIRNSNVYITFFVN